MNDDHNQAAWQLQDGDFDFLGDFDQAASLDLFGTHAQTNDAGYLHDNQSVVALHTSSGEGSVDHATFVPAPQRADRKATVKELNKRAQKRFRENQKTKWQRLQAELAASTASIQRLQSENQQLSGKNTMLEKVARLQNTEHIVTALPKQVNVRSSYANSLVHSTWAGKDSMKCTVHHTDEVISMYQVARMGPQQIAILWQEYVRELAICLVTGGQSLRWDFDSTAGRRLSQLHDELCCLCTTKANSGLEAHQAFIRSPVLPIVQSQNAANKDPDWLELGLNLKLTEGQLQNLFLLRRAYLQKKALIMNHQHELEAQLQLHALHPNTDSSLRTRNALETTYQTQDNTVQLHEAFMQYMGVIFDGVLSIWQAAMAVVSTFPHPPEVLTHIVDALAQEQGEPSAASFDVAVQSCSAVEENADALTSMENHIYKGKLLTIQQPHRTAVAT